MKIFIKQSPAGKEKMSGYEMFDILCFRLCDEYKVNKRDHTTLKRFEYENYDFLVMKNYSNPRSFSLQTYKGDYSEFHIDAAEATKKLLDEGYLEIGGYYSPANQCDRWNLIEFTCLTIAKFYFTYPLHWDIALEVKSLKEFALACKTKNIVLDAYRNWMKEKPTPHQGTDKIPPLKTLWKDLHLWIGSEVYFQIYLNFFFHGKYTQTTTNNSLNTEKEDRQVKILYKHSGDREKCKDTIAFLRQIQPTDTKEGNKEKYLAARAEGTSAFEITYFTLTTQFNYGLVIREITQRRDFIRKDSIRDAISYLQSMLEYTVRGSYISPSGEDDREFVQAYFAYATLRDLAIGTNFPSEEKISAFVSEIKSAIKKGDVDPAEETKHIYDLMMRFDIRNDFVIIGELNEKEDSKMESKVKIDVVIASLKKENKVTKVIADEARRTTVVKFDDGGVEVVKCSKDDDFDVYVGVALAKARHAAGSTTAFRKEVDSVLTTVKPKVKKEKKPEVKKAASKRKGGK